MVKNYIKSTTGKIVTLKDLSNLKAIETAENTNDLVNAIEFLKRDSKCIVEVLTDEENNLEGIFFQDKYMQRSFSNYPEVLLCDATYKHNNLRMPLYIFLIVNGNSHRNCSNISAGT
ncbi:hypothetical protein NQ314_003943 [Rhamnusium bicolor]|uniref:ZSWIM1/3 RNaseH-like domain-containing protein n=1 Tax=Rhamnusium bicolor TaxID=1586634 RepID=A0AAV8ZNZ6_9CUCU|nr:hypothetical protein NQ314_003943 [Rhamnusium bicolor]